MTYTITNPTVTISGESVPLTGTMVNTRLTKQYVTSILYEEGKWYDVNNVTHAIEFVLGNFKQQLPVHYTQVAEPVS